MVMWSACLERVKVSLRHDDDEERTYTRKTEEEYKKTVKVKKRRKNEAIKKERQKWINIMSVHGLLEDRKRERERE